MNLSLSLEAEGALVGRAVVVVVVGASRRRSTANQRAQHTSQSEVVVVCRLADTDRSLQIGAPVGRHSRQSRIDMRI